MKILIDTHYLLWSFLDTKRIPPTIYSEILNEDNEVFYSQASLWEISIKYNLGKIILNNLTPEVLYEEIEGSFFRCLRITDEDLVTFYKLPVEHRDPFDRLMIWQCIKGGLFFASNDGQIKTYTKYGLKVLK